MMEVEHEGNDGYYDNDITPYPDGHPQETGWDLPDDVDIILPPPCYWLGDCDE